MLSLERIEGKTAGEKEVEIVERKGKGHPDTLADSIAERFSNNLYQKYKQKFGDPLHYNVDKLELIGGEAVPEFGGGRVTKPIDLVFSGRAISKAGNKEIDIKRVAKKSAKEIIDNFRFLDSEKHFNYIIKTKEGSSELRGSVENIKANDTSFGVAHWPLSELEEIVLKLEEFLNSEGFKESYPFSGEDVKVMGVRKGEDYEITVAMAFVDKFISSYKDYFDKKEEVKREINDYLKKEVKVNLNTLDSKGKAYLTVTGTSLECGDDGAVGRGNRVNGLITPCREMSLEATAGKNLVSHTGKLYNVLALETAKEVYKKTGVSFCSVKLLSQIGEPILKPYLASISYKGKPNKKRVKEVYKNTLKKLPKIRGKIANEEVKIF